MCKNHLKLLLLVPMLAFIAMSHAQEDEDSSQDDMVATVEEVVVTANRRQEMLQDVPLSIAAFTESFFEDTGLTDFKSLEQYAASLRITGGGDSRRTGIRIRGIGTNGFNAGIDPSVGVFIDGIYQGRAGMSVGDFIDIERVEVLRGPQGSLYGKNTAAGAISVISKQPSYELEGKSEVTLTNYNGREFRGMLNVPFAGDDSASAMRLAGYVVKRDGWDENVFTGEDVNNSNKWGVKARTYIDLEALGFGAITVSVDASKDDSECCSPDIISREGSSVLDNRLTFEALQAEAVSGAPDLAIPMDPLVLPKDDPFDQKHAYNDEFTNYVEVNGVAVEWSMDTDNDFIYTWINAHRHYEMRGDLDSDFTPFDASQMTVDVDLDQVSSEFRIASPEGETIDYQVGAYYYYSNMLTTDTTSMKNLLLSRIVKSIPFLGEKSLLEINSLISLMNGIPPTGFFVNTGVNRHKTTTYAVFGQAVWNITDDFNATFGGRFTEETKERSGSQRTSPTYTPPFPEAPPVVGYDIDFTGADAQKFTKSNFSPTMSLRYHPRPKLMYYTSISRGFKSGGFNQLRTLGGDGTQFDEEISTSVEMGWKGTWLEGGLQWNGTFYYVDYNDFQAQIFDGAQMAVVNAGRLESKGVELELTFVPSMDWMMGGSIAYNLSEYKEFDKGECTVDRAKEWQDNNFALAANDPNKQLISTCTIDLEGKSLDNAPEFTLSSYLHYTRPLAGSNQYFWFSRLEYMHTSSFYHAQDLDPNLKNDATDVVNIRLGIADLDETWEVALWARNLTDEGYLVAATDTPMLSGYVGWTAPPRTFGLTTKYNF